jgi:hypothetical protein
MNNENGFTHIGEIIRDVVKEIARRSELRVRLEAETSSAISDEDFLGLAERDGLDI